MSKVENTLDGRKAGPATRSLMRPGIIFALLLISIFSFGALITLSGFAGDLKKNSSGEAHALSNSAIGYAAIVDLLRSQDYDVSLKRSEDMGYDEEDVLRVITLTRPYQINSLDDLDLSTATLIVLPKWNVDKLPERNGWVKPYREPIGPVFSTSSLSSQMSKFSKGVKLNRIDNNDPQSFAMTSESHHLPTAQNLDIRYLQTLEGDEIEPVLKIESKIVLGRLKDSSTYILSDPDFLNTSGIALKRRARLGQSILYGMINLEGMWDSGMIFDLSVHGFGRTQNLIKTLLTPPFLAATLCLLAAGLLIAWQAFARFGDPVRQERDFSLGKYTLADNGARFIRIAQKETDMADGYRDLIRRYAAREFNLDKLSQEKTEAFFESREQRLGMTSGWRHFSQRITHVEGKDAFLTAAQALYNWRQEIVDDHQ